MAASVQTTKSPVRVMIVDDSAIVRGLISKMLGEQRSIEIVATAFDGFSAIAEIQRHHVDVVILDIEMPRMDGLTALPELLKVSPHSKVIIASTMSQRNAEISLRALSLGASDYIAKPTSQRDKENNDQFYRELFEKIMALASASSTPAYVKPEQGAAASIQKTPMGNAFKSDAPEIKKNALGDSSIYPNKVPRAIAIASSTGGPQALLKLFAHTKGRLSHLPIFITQHMPPNFTTILATNIRQTAEKDCHEAVDGEKVKNGIIYLAPGDFHLQPVVRDREVMISLNQNPPVNFCRPAADPMIESLLDIYGQHLLVLVLTGMGSDGYLAAQKVHKAGGTVIAQDKDSSVVWGMPRAVAENQACRAVLSLEDIPAYLLKACREG
ncbi:MAG: chemotaxis-specific protein-glutamate methyltransferase CheB [Rickettsiales bacterium]